MLIMKTVHLINLHFWTCLTDFLSGRRSSAYTVINEVTVEVRFGAVLLIEKLLFSVAYEKIGVTGSHFGTHGHAINLFIITVRE